jgi:hypothetical protein
VSEKVYTLSFETYEHPTEGLLVHAQLHLAGPTWDMGWRRATDDDRKPCSAREAATQGFDVTGMEIRDDGPVAKAPIFRVDVTGEFGETQGEIHDDGIAIGWGGACPVQGEGSVDGRVLYYRARGSGWSIDVAEGSPEEFDYGQAPYIWPDGGWLCASESEHNIRIGVAKWRKWLAARIAKEGAP